MNYSLATSQYTLIAPLGFVSFANSSSKFSNAIAFMMMSRATKKNLIATKRHKKHKPSSLISCAFCAFLWLFLIGGFDEALGAA